MLRRSSTTPRAPWACKRFTLVDELAGRVLVELLERDVADLSVEHDRVRHRRNTNDGARELDLDGAVTPGRANPTVTFVPGVPVSASAVFFDVHPRVATVSTSTITSPSRMPARSAGVLWKTLATVMPLPCCSSIDMPSPPYRPPVLLLNDLSCDGDSNSLYGSWSWPTRPRAAFSYSVAASTVSTKRDGYEIEYLAEEPSAIGGGALLEHESADEKRCGDNACKQGGASAFH